MIIFTTQVVVVGWVEATKPNAAPILVSVIRTTDYRAR